MSIKEKLFCIAGGFCFLFFLLLSPNGWGSGFPIEEPRDGSSLFMRTPLEEEIRVLPKDAFENLRTRLGGSTLSSSTFRERATGKVWIGKSQGQPRPDTMELDQEMNESLACREKIASDIYRFYGVAVPYTVLSPQEMTNTPLGLFAGQEAIHIMSRKEEGYHDYKTQFRFSRFEASLDPTNGPAVCHDNRCTIEGCVGIREGEDCVVYEAEGAGKAAAVATWVHDVDYIGGSATNAGYRIVRHGGQVVAKFIVVDPGESFSDPADRPYPAPRYIRFASQGMVDTHHTIPFERLCPAGSRARGEFLMTLHSIIDTDEPTIARFFMRRGAEFFVTRDPRSAQGLTRQLIERKRQLADHYAPELIASRAQYEELKRARDEERRACALAAVAPTPKVTSATNNSGRSTTLIKVGVGVGIFTLVTHIVGANADSNHLIQDLCNKIDGGLPQIAKLLVSSLNANSRFWGGLVPSLRAPF